MGRTLESLSRLERKWLRRRFCGWCEISCLATKCGARSDLTPSCDMDERRAKWLESYKPRTTPAKDETT